MRNLTIILTAALLLGAVGISRAAESSYLLEYPEAMNEFTDGGISMNMEVELALREIAERAGMNVVMSKMVAGAGITSVDLKHKVRMRDLFDILLLSNRLACTKVGDIYYIMTREEYSKRYGSDYGDPRQVKAFRLQYASPEKAFAVTESLKSDIGDIIVDQDTGTIVLIDTPQKIAVMMETLAVLEEEMETVVINLNYADAKNVEDHLKAQLDKKKVGTIVADEGNNQVIITALPGRIKQAREIIKALDKKTKQVLIDANIIQIRLRDNFAAEVKWEGVFRTLSGIDFLGSHPFEPLYRTGRTNIGNFTRIDPEGVNPLPADKNLFGERIYLGQYSASQTGNSYEGMLNFLRTLGDVKILSNPKITVINKAEAVILIGRREPFITTTTAQAQTTTTVAEEIEFVEVGIKLTVTPTINDEGYIKLEIKPEISSVVEKITTQSGNVIPVVDTSEAETTVIVKNNATIMIGGLRKEEEATTTRKVPFLGSIPLLGFLFRSHHSEKIRTELLVMITPHIITGDILDTGNVIVPQEAFKPYVDYGSSSLAPFGRVPEVAEVAGDVPGIAGKSRSRSRKKAVNY